MVKSGAAHIGGMIMYTVHSNVSLQKIPWMRIAGKSHVGYGKSSVLSPKSLNKNQEEDLESYDSDDEEEEGLLHRFAPFLTESRSEDLGGPGF